MFISPREQQHDVTTGNESIIIQHENGFDSSNPRGVTRTATQNFASPLDENRVWALVRLKGRRMTIMSHGSLRRCIS
ncbi:hypothetical protein DTO280E4_54 [Paecilomyces variotii]|nr:hypothetical protein DTO280E4_54 [Paecilomyces variotii]